MIDGFRCREETADRRSCGRIEGLEVRTCRTVSFRPHSRVERNMR